MNAIDTTTHTDLADRQAGWADCRAYRGYDAQQGPAYQAGFDACTRAYHDAIRKGQGWDAVPKVAPAA